jgi:hypothetical protein
LIFALLAMAILAAPALGQVGTLCMQSQYKADGNNQKLNCTANDVSIAFADNARDLNGVPYGPNNGCQAGSTFSFVADFHVVTTATQRENIGLYFETKGSGNAITGASGTCWDNIISPPHKVAGDTVCLGSGATADATCTGAGTYEQLDASPDTCGDISTSDNNQIITVEVDNAVCVAGANGMLLLPNAVSWQQQGGTLLCQSGPTNYPFSANAIPGAPSKCSHNDTFTVPIVVQSPQVSVSKTCDIGGGPLSSCDFGATVEGGNVTYTITVTNTSTFGSVTLDQICDSYYGNIATASGFTPACGSGTGTPNSGSVTCVLPHTLAASGQAGNSYSCQFQATQGESATVMDIATANGVGTNGTTPFTGSSTQVTVKSGEAASTATITKSYNSTTAACATVRYQADVANTSGGDETVTMSGLTDDGFDLTKINTDANNSTSPVIGTTCGVATGRGSLTPVCDTVTTHKCTSGNVGTSCTQASDCALAGGAFAGTPYTCHFDAQFCGTPAAIANEGNCISHKDTVTGTATGDEAETVSVTAGTITVDECFTPFVH